QHSVKGVHENFDGLGSDGIAGLLGRLALRKKAREQLGQDTGLTAKACSVGGADQVLVGGGGCDVARRIDVEGENEARVEAFEIEAQDVLVKTGDRLQNGASQSGLRDRLRLDGGGHQTALPDLGEVEEVEGSDASRDSIQRHSREQAPL